MCDKFYCNKRFVKVYMEPFRIIDSWFLIEIGFGFMVVCYLLLFIYVCPFT